MPNVAQHGNGDGSGSDPARRAAWIGLAVAAASALLLTVGVASGWSWLLSADQRLEQFTRDWADPLGWPVDLAHAIGLATSPLTSTILIVVAALLLTYTGHRAAAAYVALSGAAGVLVVELAKVSVGRERPPGAEAFESDLLKSFPSGHSSAGIYAYLTLGMVLLQLGRARGSGAQRAAGWALVALGPVIGLSRLVLGVHWPSDVLGGWAFGSTATLTAALLLWAPLGSGWTAPPRRAQVRSGTRPTAQVTSEPQGGDEGP